MKRIISSLVSAGISTVIISIIFYLMDYKSNEYTMFSWAFVIIYFLLMFVASLLKDDFDRFWKRMFKKNNS